MKKIILGFIIVTLFGCSKEVIKPVTPVPVIVTPPVNTQPLSKIVYYGKTSYELRSAQTYINIDSLRGKFGIRSIGRWGGNNNLGFVYVDMNNDGMEDIFYPYSADGEFNLKPEVFINTGSGYIRDNTMLPNDYVGNQNTRKTLVGDFNNDSLPDFFLINHGYENPDINYFPGETNRLILSNKTLGKYTLGSVPLGRDFWHGGASGDLNGDGNIDIVISSGKPILLLGNGRGEFTKTDMDFKNDNLGAYITIEITDVDRNGTNDIIMSGDEGQRNHVTISKSTILLNNGNLIFQSVGITHPNEVGWKFVMDIGCEDIDGDGVNEIFLCRTRDNTSVWFNGYTINIYKKAGDGYEDVSDKFIKNNRYIASDRNYAGFWIYQMNLKKEKDGLYSINAYVSDKSTVQYWKQNSVTKQFE
jgi:hypothetical protein